MSKLDDFLGLTDISEVRKTITVKVNGKDLELVIRPITEEEHTEFQRRSNNISKNKVTFDSGKYNNLVISSFLMFEFSSSIRIDSGEGEWLCRYKSTGTSSSASFSNET